MRLNSTNTITLVIMTTLMLISKVSTSQININSLPYNPAVTGFNSFNPTNLTNALSTIPAGWSFSSAGSPAYNGQSITGSISGGYWSYTYLFSGDYNLGDCVC